MVSAFLNTVKIPELRRRILFTLAVIVIVRLGAAITTPGVNPAVLQDWFRTSSQSAGGGVAALFNLFSGGALENCAICEGPKNFSTGVVPRCAGRGDPWTSGICEAEATPAGLKLRFTRGRFLSARRS